MQWSTTYTQLLYNRSVEDPGAHIVQIVAPCHRIERLHWSTIIAESATHNPNLDPIRMSFLPNSFGFHEIIIVNCYR